MQLFSSMRRPTWSTRADRSLAHRNHGRAHRHLHALQRLLFNESPQGARPSSSSTSAMFPWHTEAWVKAKREELEGKGLKHVFAQEFLRDGTAGLEASSSRANGSKQPSTPAPSSASSRPARRWRRSTLPTAARTAVR